MSVSTNYFISQLQEPVISQRDYKINEGGTKTFWFKLFLMLIEGHVFHWQPFIVRQPFLVSFARYSSKVWPQLGFPEWTGTRGSLLLVVFLSSLALTKYAKIQDFSCQMLTRRSKREIEGFFLSWKLRKRKIRKTAFCLDCPQQWAQQVAEHP